MTILAQTLNVIDVAETGVSFRKSTSRTTDVIEGGVQTITLALALGIITVDEEIETSEQLVKIISALPDSVMNHRELVLLGARLHNGNDESKIKDAVNLGKICYQKILDEGFNDQEIASHLRWMSKESTQGVDGTVGDVGIDLSDGRSVHVSLKVCSSILHNGSPSQAMSVLNVENYDPFTDDNVAVYDAIAFNAAWDFLKEKIDSSENGESFKDGDKEWRIHSFDGIEYIVYLSNRRNLIIPATAFSDILEWKMLSQNEQKVLSYFVTSNIKEIEALPVYKDAAVARQSCISSNIVDYFNNNDEMTQRIFTAKMIGLRNRGALYLSSGNKGGLVHTGRIPTIDSFVNDPEFAIGEPVVAHGGNSVKIPISNSVNNKVMILNIRTRFVDGQFNYKGQRMTGEYVCSEFDVAHFNNLPEYENSVFATVAEVIFDK